MDGTMPISTISKIVFDAVVFTHDAEGRMRVNRIIHTHTHLETDSKTKTDYRTTLAHRHTGWDVPIMHAYARPSDAHTKNPKQNNRNTMNGKKKKKERSTTMTSTTTMSKR